MGTRSIIARAKGDGWEGRYHHWDGYPSGLGAGLYDHYHRSFGRNLKRMLEVLIDEHPSGWSTINGADFSLPIGFQDHTDPCKICGREYSDHLEWPAGFGAGQGVASIGGMALGHPHARIPYEEQQQFAQCYCHGTRNEDRDDLRTHDQPHGFREEYLYVLSMKQGVGIGRNRMLVFDTHYGMDILIGEVDLDEPEPDWDMEVPEDHPQIAIWASIPWEEKYG
jgi:hypothetical protein